jgi:hypothetical protein
MLRYLPLVLGVAAVTASAYDSGRQSGRWGKSDQLATVTERLHKLSPEIGDWESEPVKLDARQLQVAGVVSHESRAFKNRKTGARVQMLLICGRPGPISVHEPTVCYTSAGYGQSGDLTKQVAGDDVFKVGKFVKGPPNADILRIMWGWTTDGRWQAPDNPRRAFGRGNDALMKLYLIRQVGPDDGNATDPTEAFLADLLPELRRCLSPNS